MPEKQWDAGDNGQGINFVVLNTVLLFGYIVFYPRSGVEGCLSSQFKTLILRTVLWQVSEYIGIRRPD